MTVAKVIVTNAVKEAGYSDSSPFVTGNPQDLNWELQVKTSGIMFLTFLTCCRYTDSIMVVGCICMGWSKARMEYGNY